MPKARQLQRARREEQAASPLDAAFKLVDSLAVPVFFKSRDGRYLGVNRAWEEFFGIRGEAFIGKQVADLYPQDPAIAERHAAMDRELYAHPGRREAGEGDVVGRGERSEVDPPHAVGGTLRCVRYYAGSQRQPELSDWKRTESPGSIVRAGGSSREK